MAWCYKTVHARHLNITCFHCVSENYATTVDFHITKWILNFSKTFRTIYVFFSKIGQSRGLVVLRTFSCVSFNRWLSPNGVSLMALTSHWKCQSFRKFTARTVDILSSILCIETDTTWRRHFQTSNSQAWKALIEVYWLISMKKGSICWPYCVHTRCIVPMKVIFHSKKGKNSCWLRVKVTQHEEWISPFNVKKIK